MGYNKDGEQVEVTAYKHPIHDNEALFIQEMPDSDEVVYRILDCCGDNNHYDDLGTALNEFLGVIGEHMWMDSLGYNQHTNRDIWIKKSEVAPCIQNAKRDCPKCPICPIAPKCPPPPCGCGTKVKEKVIIPDDSPLYDKIKGQNKGPFYGPEPRVPYDKIPRVPVGFSF